MPGMRGPEIAERIRERRPGLPVMFLSAYPDGLAADSDLTASDAVYVSKPFRIDESLGTVREMLRRTAAPPTNAPPDAG